MPLVFGSDTIATFRQILDRAGYLFIAGLPADFDHLSFAEQFGPLMLQYHNEYVWTVKARLQFESSYHSLNRSTLYPHTECYEFEGLPPRFQAFWCVHPSRDAGGATTIADAYQFIESLSAEDRNYVSRKKYRFSSSSGIQKSGLGRSAVHPIYDTESTDRPVVRLSVNCMERDEDDKKIEDLLEHVLLFFQENQLSIQWLPNAMLVIDNWRMMHSRTGYEDWKRELKRVWIAHDNGAQQHD